METKILIVISYVICTLIIGNALFSTPDLSIALHPKSAIENLLGYLLCSIVCAYPWWRMYLLPDEHNGNKLVFSILVVVLATLFYNPISTGRDFTIGMFVIFYLASIGITFLVTRYIK